MSILNYRDGVISSNSSITLDNNGVLHFSITPKVDAYGNLYFPIDDADTNKRERKTKLRFYIASPNAKIKRGLLGVNKAQLKAYLNDIWEISFEVDKYITSRIGTKKKNPIYDMLSLSMEIMVDKLGWFRINNEPRESFDGERWYKTFTAYGYETILQDIDLVGIVINCGTEDSIEMYEENLDIRGIPKRNIQLYIKNSNEDPTSENYWKLGLLNILEREYLSKKGWKIGNIETGLSTLRGRTFELDSINAYRFLTNELPAAYKCIPIFDRINRTIDFVKLESLGKDLNIELNLRNFINSINIVDRNDEYFNRFRVSGNDSETPIIEYINYGSDKIVNLDYCMKSGMFESSTIEKYNLYKEWLENNRNAYAEYTKEFLRLSEQKTNLQELMPVQEIEVLYTNVSDEELEIELLHFQEVIAFLEELHTVDGVLQIESTVDYPLYISSKEVMIPKIQAEINARKEGKHAEDFEYDTNWELYGVNELNVRKVAYKAQIDILIEKGFDVPWSENSSETEVYHTKQHETYLEYVGHIEKIDKRLDKLNTWINEIDESIKHYSSSQVQLAQMAKLENEYWGFTESELKDIYFIYRDTDFTDSTIEILETDTIDDIIQLAWDLYNSATEQLEIESHPQLAYETSIDNLFKHAKFKKKLNDLSLGDFCFIGLDNGFHTKQRIVELSMELIDLSNNNVSIVFSDMTTVCGKADDYRFILEKGSGSSKNSISRGTANYVSNAATSIANTVATQLLNKYFGTSGSVFPNGINQSDLQKLADALDGLVKGELSIEELKANLAKIDTLEADSAFIKYLDAKYLVGDVGDFKELQADIANIKQALIGVSSTETGIVINLKASNAVIDEAFLKDLIATYITVSDLKSGNIVLSNAMQILSESGKLIMNGETMQIIGTYADTDGNEVEYVAIQLGYDSTNNPSLIIRDKNGAVMLDADGLHEAIVPDEFIKTDMIGKNQVVNDNIDWSTITEDTDKDGKPVWNASSIKIDDKTFDVAYTTIKEDIEKNSTNIDKAGITIDQLTKEIGLTVTGDMYTSKISTMEADIENASVGINKWLIEIYHKENFPEAMSSIIDDVTDYSIFYSENNVPVYQFLQDDSTLNNYIGYGLDYIGYALTFVQCDVPKNVVVKFNPVSKGSLYLNGVERRKSNTEDNDEINLSFKNGWNVIEVIWNVSDEERNNDGFSIEPIISGLECCKLMNCYYQTITGRECYINSKSAGITVNLDKITSKVSEIETNMSDKADTDYLNERFSLIEQDIDSWQASFNDGIDYGTTIIDKNGIVIEGSDSTVGITVRGTTSGMYETIITPNEFSGYYDGEKVFYLNGEETVTKRLYVERGIAIGNIKIVDATQDNIKGIDFVDSAFTQILSLNEGE